MGMGRCLDDAMPACLHVPAPQLGMLALEPSCSHGTHKAAGMQALCEPLPCWLQAPRLLRTPALFTKQRCSTLPRCMLGSAPAHVLEAMFVGLEQQGGRMAAPPWPWPALAWPSRLARLPATDALPAACWLALLLLLLLLLPPAAAAAAAAAAAPRHPGPRSQPARCTHAR